MKEHMTVLNSQLQRSLESQCLTFDDLKNVLVSSDTATLVLDLGLRIRFFTPATRRVFSIMASDIGRPIADLRSLAGDETLLQDVALSVREQAPSEREIEAAPTVWLARKIFPYFDASGAARGVVITYTDVSKRHAAEAAQASALRRVELVSRAKSRFLAAASHDLRQPLQTLHFVHGLLVNVAEGPDRGELLARMDLTLESMSAMLDTLLDINKIEAGLMATHKESVSVASVFDAIHQEFRYLADAKGLNFRVAPCSLWIWSDRRLLEQMLRNLVANAIKFTTNGGVLLGARRLGRTLRLEVWDSGVGLAGDDLNQVFEEYYQVEGAKRGAGEGLGLGLAIVRRLGELLDHTVVARSVIGRGSVFSIEVPRARSKPQLAQEMTQSREASSNASARARDPTAHVLVVDDDAEMARSLAGVLAAEGFRVSAAQTLETACAVVRDATPPVKLLLADYNLAGVHTGLDVAAALQKASKTPLAMLILTGDISVKTSQEIHRAGFRQINKPVKTAALAQAVWAAIAGAPALAPSRPPLAPESSVVVVDDDAVVRASLVDAVCRFGHNVQGFASGEDFLAALSEEAGPPVPRCLILDAYLGGMSGLDVLKTLRSATSPLAVVMLTGRSDVATAVAAMKAGAVDYLTKPLQAEVLAGVVDEALAWARTKELRDRVKADAVAKIATLSPRERQVMIMVLAGSPSKNIAADLCINQRTVENHRAAVMRKTQTRSIPALARLAMIEEIACEAGQVP